MPCRVVGDWKTAFADGTKCNVYEQNLLSEYHIHYGGYGCIGYYHVSDMYIALFSRFIPCGVYEAVYILDGLVKNDSDIQPDTVHGDTLRPIMTLCLVWLICSVSSGCREFAISRNSFSSNRRRGATIAISTVCSEPPSTGTDRAPRP